MVRNLAMFVMVIIALALPACGSEKETQESGPLAPETTVSDVGAEAAPQWTAATTIGTIVAERPSTARVFELVGIDYCCGGARALAVACAEQDVDPQRVLDVLTLVAGTQPRTAAERDWTRASTKELVDHIVGTHHAFLRRELPRLTGIVATVTRAHGEAHPELPRVQEAFAALRDDLLPHLDEEEKDVFPLLLQSSKASPDSLRVAVKRLRHDHDEAGSALKSLRSLTKGYEIPDDACALYTQMMEGLLALERDLHAHVHLENNALLPRAEALCGTGACD